MSVKTQTLWRAVLGAAVVAIIAEYWWAADYVFVGFYEPYINPTITRFGTIVESIVWAPLVMLYYLWWLTIPLVGIVVLAWVNLRKLKKKGIRTR